MEIAGRPPIPGLDKTAASKSEGGKAYEQQEEEALDDG
jgi:hypothetical protein